MANTKESLWRGLGPIGSIDSPNIQTIASAATIAPTRGVVEITGTTNISTVTPPYVGFSGTIRFIHTNAAPGDFVTGGNIAKAVTTTAQFDVVSLTYNPATSLWYPALL